MTNNNFVAEVIFNDLTNIDENIKTLPNTTLINLISHGSLKFHNIISQLLHNFISNTIIKYAIALK